MKSFEILVTYDNLQNNWQKNYLLDKIDQN